eukprot:NODE_705_length_4578_cov_0.471087.p4 type:complete len:216 gc:universal NODE_705_length_4578_cov_0.471087:1217-1864(+)
MEVHDGIDCRIQQDIKVKMSCWKAVEGVRLFSSMDVRSNQGSMTFTDVNEYTILTEMALKCKKKNCEFQISNQGQVTKNVVKYGKLTPLQPFEIIHGDLYCRQSRDGDNQYTPLSKLILIVDNGKKSNQYELRDETRVTIDGVTIFIANSKLKFEFKGEIKEMELLEVDGDQSDKSLKLNNPVKLSIKHKWIRSKSFVISDLSALNSQEMTEIEF